MSKTEKTRLAGVIAGIAALAIIIGVVANSEAIGKKVNEYLINTMTEAALSTAE